MPITGRADFGGTTADFTVDPNAPFFKGKAGVLTFWSASSGGTQYSDLLVNGQSVTQVVVGSDGQIPRFQGPPGVTTMWAEDGVDATGRVAILALAAIADDAAASASLAATERQGAEAAKIAAQAVGTTNDTVIAGRINDPASATKTSLNAITSPIAGRTGRQNVFHVVGDSLSANGIPTAGRPYFGDARNPWAWATLYSNGKLQLGTIAATGGFTTSQILATHLPTALAAARPGDRIVVLGGTNDGNITGGIGGTLSRANLLSMYQQIRDAGCFPVGVSIPPVGFAFGTGAVSGAETAASAGLRLALSSWIETTCRRNGWEFLDYFSVISNPLATGSVFEGSLAQDAIHPNEAGGKALGAYIATQLTRQDTPVSRLAAHRIASGDGYLFGNATMGDSNSDGIPDQFTATAPSPGTATPFSLVTVAGVAGPMFRVNRDASGTGNGLAQTAGAAVVAGRRYFFGFKVQANVVTPGSTSKVIAHLYSTTGPTYLAGIGLGGFDRSIPLGTFATEFVAPASFNVNFQMQAVGGPCSIDVGQLTLYDLTALGF